MRHLAIKASAAGLVAALALVVPIASSAGASGYASPAGRVTGIPAASTTTLPLFGTPLTIDITTGPGGALTSVSVNPADGLTATLLKPNKVRFVNGDGTAKVEVKSKGGGQKVETKAGSLADVSGAGQWSGDLFGDGVATTVDFVIGATPEGGPDITGVATSDPTAEIGDVRRRLDDEEQRADVTIRFVSGLQSRTLSIRVAVHTDTVDEGHDGATTDEGHEGAKVSVVLSKLTGVSLPAIQVAGEHSWRGLLCDGTEAVIIYVVAEDGTISGVVTDPDTADVHADDKGINVRFSKHERVRIQVRSHDGELKISVREKIRCDSPAPTVNTPVSVPEIDPSKHHDRDGKSDDHRPGSENRHDD